MDVSGPRALGRLRAACEEARRSLSINARVSIEVDSLFEVRAAVIRISSAAFIVASFFRRAWTLRPF